MVVKPISSAGCYTSDMALYYITGISGAGKSTTYNELKCRGYQVFGTDEDELAYYYHNQTGQRAKPDIKSSDKTLEWRSEYSWKLPKEEVERLARQAVDHPVFLCGVTSNDTDDYWHLFDKIFALHIDEPTLRERILKRTNNDFGKAENEFNNLLEWHKTAEADYRTLGATIIDTQRPVDEVVDQILQSIT